jgi:hypothetical protein
MKQRMDCAHEVNGSHLVCLLVDRYPFFEILSALADDMRSGDYLLAVAAPVGWMLDCLGSRRSADAIYVVNLVTPAYVR